MRRAIMQRCGLVLLAVVLSVAPASAQKAALDSLFRAHRMALSFEGDTPSGPGWDFLVGQASRAQFVMVGESHNVREIPLFTGRLFGVLHDRAGFDHLALEDGPWAIGMLMKAGVRGVRDTTFVLAARYVNALQFLSDQEVDLIVDAGRVSSARGAPVWGLDQTWGTLHILERLQQLVVGREAGELVAGIADRARAVEAYRPEEENRPRFLTQRLTKDDLAALHRAIAGSPPEAHRLLDMLETSWEIYATRTDGPAIYRSNDRRERWMKARLAEEYDAARAAGDSLPRVLLKFGQWHAIRGVLNWGDVQSLGTFVSEFAHRNGHESLHIWTGLVNEPGRFWTLFDSPEYVPIAEAGSTDSWWVVDLRPIRPLVAAGQVSDVNEEMRKVIFGFDLALLIGNGNQAERDRLIEVSGRRQR